MKQNTENSVIQFFIESGYSSKQECPYTWKYLADKLNYSSDEAIRSDYRRNKYLLNNSSLNAKILIFDIETAPSKAYIWNFWQENINPLGDFLISEWFMLSWSAKWLHDEEVLSDVLTSEEVLSEDDSRICKSIWNLLNEADIVVAHNGDKYDIKRLNTRFLINNMLPTSSYVSIDTLKHAKKQFDLPSNKLDYLAKILGLDGKIKTNQKLWVDCMKGNKEALEAMRLYCDQDVYLLESVYLKLRPFMKGHPNVNIYSEKYKPACASCGSEHLLKSGQFATNTSVFETFRCKSCGSISRTRNSILPTDCKKSLTVSVTK